MTRVQQEIEQRIRTSPVAVTFHACLRYQQRYERVADDVIERRLRRRVRRAEVIKPVTWGYRVTTGDLTLAVKEDEGTVVVLSVWGRRRWA